MPSIEFDGVGYHAEIQSTAPIPLPSPPFQQFLDALVRIDLLLAPQSLALEQGDPGEFDYALEMAGGNSINATLRIADRSRQTSTSFLTLAQLLAHNPTIEAMFALVAASATSVEVTWA